MIFVFWYLECNCSTRTLELWSCNSRSNWLELHVCTVQSWDKARNQIRYTSQLSMSFGVNMVRSGATPLALEKRSLQRTLQKIPLAVRRASPVCSRLGFLFDTSLSKPSYCILAAASHHQNQAVKIASGGTFSVDCCKDKLGS